MKVLGMFFLNIVLLLCGVSVGWNFMLGWLGVKGELGCWDMCWMCIIG